ncbi:MAG: hypothetical protein F2839_03350 [Actinobacteria bacterium]|uniref:Unannotated protein n=1 Tax=freshwater metagenome TaxID=449393 RepID=A0A6J5Z8M4_9ZZZZ|nr:hypothetical protein [Actinomycetota bacterium]
MIPQGFVVETVEVHAAGEAGRVIMNMGELVKGDTMEERFEYARNNLDGFRRLILREPRGFPSLCGVFVLPPVSADSAYGMIVLEQGTFTPMSGSNTICSVTAMLETGRIPMTEPITVVKIDTAVGQITTQAHCKNGKVTGVTIENVPAFVVHKDFPLDVPEYGIVPTDIIFGGQFFAQSDVAHFGLEIDPNKGRELTRIGALVRIACDEQVQVQHPLNPNIKNVNLIVFHTGDPVPGKPSKNTMAMSYGALSKDNPASWTGTLDRSPCGTGTSARVAGLYARGLLKLNEEFIHESIIGTQFIARAVREVKIGEYDGVVPELTGQGWVTGKAQWFIDATDPFQEGFMLSDIWPPN